MIICTGGRMFSNALVCDDVDDDRCGLCFGGPEARPLGPEHSYVQHLEVELPDQTYEIVTARYVLIPFLDDGWSWSRGLEPFVSWLQEQGHDVLAMRRQFHALSP